VKESSCADSQTGHGSLKEKGRRSDTQNICVPRCSRKYVWRESGRHESDRQAKQIACPLTGKKASAAITVTTKEIKVRFCCNDCKNKVVSLKEKEQLKLVFSNEAFKRAYKVTAADTAE